jgi:photosystem II stability/assembly factor-like uncharacterized protein
MIESRSTVKMSLLLLLFLMGCKKEEDFNKPWQVIDVPFKQALQDVHFLNKDVGYMLGQNQEVGNWFNVLLKTADGGKTWSVTEFEPPQAGGVADLFALSPTDIFTTKHGVFRSANEGVSWEDLNSALSSSAVPIRGIYFSDPQHGVIGKGLSFYWTEDGHSFHEVYVKTSGTSIKSLQQVDGVLFATAGTPGSTGILFKSVDGGKSWQRIDVNAGYISSLHFVSKAIGYLLCNNNVYQTIDGGESWHIQTVTNLPSNVAYLGFLDRKRGVYATWEGEIYESTNEGRSWVLKKKLSGVGLSKMQVFYNKVFIMGTGGTLLIKEL